MVIWSLPVPPSTIELVFEPVMVSSPSPPWTAP
jgi:hypothetical protein